MAVHPVERIGGNCQRFVAAQLLWFHPNSGYDIAGAETSLSACAIWSGISSSSPGRAWIEPRSACRPAPRSHPGWSRTQASATSVGLTPSPSAAVAVHLRSGGRLRSGTAGRSWRTRGCRRGSPPDARTILPGQNATAQGGPGDQSHPVGLEGRQDLPARYRAAARSTPSANRPESCVPVRRSATWRPATSASRRSC